MSNNNDYNAIDILKGSKGSNIKYFCDYCNRSLFIRDKEKDPDEYICINCNILYYPRVQQVKTANRFANPGPETNEQGTILGNSDRIPIAIMDVQQVSSTSYGRIDLPKAYKAMKNYTWTSFEER